MAKAVRPPREKSLGSILKQKAYTAFDGKAGRKRLPELCLELLAQQKESWPELRQGCESLASIRTRDIACAGFSVRLQYNPGRITNSMAEVSPAGVSERPCFLCPGHLPEEQKGILYRSQYLILANPRPIFPAHFTISHVEHRPQEISEEMDTFLRLLCDFGSGWTVFYNGPRCGASAPDHLHFQACPAGQLPVEKEIGEAERRTPLRGYDGIIVYRLNDMGRETVILEGSDAAAVSRGLKNFLNALRRVLTIREEPMMNIAGFHDEKKWRLVIFPRRKHRPDAFFREGDARVVVSPGLIDMGGVLVTPAEKDFKGLDAAAAEAIYREVSLETIAVEKALGAPAQRPIR